jgi:hypothetical protein
MKKIGILTLYGNENYGNKLQNFALQSFLIENKFKPETIIISFNHNMNFSFKYLKTIINILSKFKSLFFNSKLEVAKVENLIENFSKNNLTLTPKLSNYKALKKYSTRFTKLIVGSDQIWNPNSGNFSGVNFLSFVPKIKRVAYAPSFGVLKIKNEYSSFLKKYLDSFTFLSTREISGCDFIEELIDKKPSFVVDPVLLFDHFFWESKIEVPLSFKTSHNSHKEFSFCYFLTSEVYENDTPFLINQFTINKNNIKNYSPFEFLYLIKSSNIVITDSYHAVLFSLLFKKRFILKKRKFDDTDMNSRFSSLFIKLLGFDSIPYDTLIDDSIDFTFLNKLIIESKIFLIKSLFN